MANEITFSTSLSCYKAAIMSAAKSRSLTNVIKSMAGIPISEGSLVVTTSDTAIVMNGVSQPHWAWFYNPDSTNFVQIKTAVGGTYFLRLYPGEGQWVPLDIGLTAPYAKADTASVTLEYLILSL